MKLAISGKGGVGKSTVAGTLSRLYAANGNRVLAVDADPDANLASAVGLPPFVPRSTPSPPNASLIEERTGAKVRQFGQKFKINPEVSDIAGNYAIHYKGVDLLVLGAVQHAAGGCACPESAVRFEPLVSAAAYALASILDRRRHRVFPASAAREALRQQAACLAARLAGRLDRWPEFHASLAAVDMKHPQKLILAAIALGWSKKWATRRPSICILAGVALAWMMS